MADTDITIVIQTNSNKSIVDVSGEFSVYTAPELKRQLIKLCESDCIQIILNLSGLDYIDSTGLGVLINVLKRMRDKDGDLVLVCSRQRIRNAFKLTGLDNMFTLHATEVDYLQAQQQAEAQ
jgi:anti-sigma B factor antagonist